MFSSELLIFMGELGFWP